MAEEDILKKINGKVVVGIDEVGRGCWAGPLVVGAVVLSKPIKGLQDSKKTSKSARRALALAIREHATACSTGWVSPAEVDRLGLTAATTLAIERAIENIIEYDYLIIDGSVNFLPKNPKTLTLIRGDSLVPAVSAASILAKVARDEYMVEQSLLYPDYGFDKHVGYGTSFHKKAIVDFGITSLHRKSFKPLRLMV